MSRISFKFNIAMEMEMRLVKGEWKMEKENGK